MKVSRKQARLYRKMQSARAMYWAHPLTGNVPCTEYTPEMELLGAKYSTRIAQYCDFTNQY